MPNSSFKSVRESNNCRNCSTVSREAGGFTRTYTHSLVNNGSTTDTFDLSVASSQGWVISLSQSSLNLGASQSAQISVTVNLPASGANGLVDITLVEARSTSSGGNIAAVAADVTTLLNPASIVLSTGRAAEAAPGSTAIYTHSLANLGASLDTFSIAAASSRGWTTQLSHGQVTLQPGASAVITLHVLVPASAVPATLDESTLTATSAYGALARASSTNTTTVVGTGLRAIYLPLVVRNYP